MRIESCRIEDNQPTLRLVPDTDLDHFIVDDGGTKGIANALDIYDLPLTDYTAFTEGDTSRLPEYIRWRIPLAPGVMEIAENVSAWDSPEGSVMNDPVTHVIEVSRKIDRII